jgi:hypothetical protein
MFSCKKDNPIPPDELPQINLTLEDTSCTEAWIKLTTVNISLPAELTLKQDNSKAQTINLSSVDTILYVDSLLPNTNYKYQASSIQHQVSSNLLNVTTMDTTSHNFTWQTFTFGNPNFGSSELNDVAIIDENNIWAVGEIYNDTTGLLYNAVHWDGSQWELKRISVIHNGSLITPPLYGVYAFSASDIWLSSGVPVHGDGTSWTQYHLFDMGILGQDDGYLTKIWGNSSNNLYYVGTLGTIVHYYNGTWSKIESGTTTNINDVWGYYDNDSNEGSLLCVVSNILHQGELRLLAISDNTTHDTLNWPYSHHWLNSVWFKNKYSPVYVVGGGIKEYKRGVWTELNLTNNFVECIRGTDVNDIIVCGDYGFVGHFNGVQWNVINNLYNDAVFLKAAVNENTVVIVGYTYSGILVGKAIVIVGKRIN